MTTKVSDLVLDPDLNRVTWEMRATSGAPQSLPSRALPDVCYAGFARSIGLDGARAARPDDVAGAWRTALAADRPFVAEFWVDPAVPPVSQPPPPAPHAVPAPGS